MALLERGGIDAHSSANHHGLELNIEVVAEIDDEYRLPGAELRLVLFRADPRDPQLAEEELAARYFDAQIEPEGAGGYCDRPTSQSVGEKGRLD